MTETDPTHFWLALCPTCGSVQAACVDSAWPRQQTFVREHLLAGYTMQRVLRDEARTSKGTLWGECGHPLTRHDGNNEPVALRGYVPVTVRSDLSHFFPTREASPGVYPITMNRYGAACAVLPDGSRLGLKPDEFVWTDAPTADGGTGERRRG